MGKMYFDVTFVHPMEIEYNCEICGEHNLFMHDICIGYHKQENVNRITESAKGLAAQHYGNEAKSVANAR